MQISKSVKCKGENVTLWSTGLLHNFNWLEFIDIAEILVKEDGPIKDFTEARWRIAISRIYFGVFNHFKRFLKNQRGLDFTDTGLDHIFLRTYLQQFIDEDCAMWVDKLRRLRNESDYDDFIPFIESKGRLAFELWNNIKNKCIIL